jgi:hypothetical protein
MISEFFLPLGRSEKSFAELVAQKRLLTFHVEQLTPTTLHLSNMFHVEQWLKAHLNLRPSCRYKSSSHHRPSPQGRLPS